MSRGCKHLKLKRYRCDTYLAFRRFPDPSSPVSARVGTVRYRSLGRGPSTARLRRHRAVRWFVILLRQNPGTAPGNTRKGAAAGAATRSATSCISSSRLDARQSFFQSVRRTTMRRVRVQHLHTTRSRLVGEGRSATESATAAPRSFLGLYVTWPWTCLCLCLCQKPP